MLNLKGAFVVLRGHGPEPIVLDSRAYRLYQDRVQVAGFDKANAYTFGTDTTAALPCVLECMQTVALHFQGAHAEQVRAMCACIALGKPLGTDDGGLGVISDDDMPKPKPSPARVQAPAEIQSINF